MSGTRIQGASRFRFCLVRRRLPHTDALVVQGSPAGFATMRAAWLAVPRSAQGSAVDIQTKRSSSLLNTLPPGCCTGRGTSPPCQRCKVSRVLGQGALAGLPARRARGSAVCSGRLSIPVGAGQTSILTAWSGRCPCRPCACDSHGFNASARINVLWGVLRMSP